LDRPDLERLYGRLEDEYELIERAETLDRKLDFISASASALVELKDADRSLRLELVIAFLILAELALALVPLFRASLLTGTDFVESAVAFKRLERQRFCPRRWRRNSFCRQETSCWPPSMSYVAPVRAVLLMM
jgi:hypothetical protein